LEPNEVTKSCAAQVFLFYQQRSAAKHHAEISQKQKTKDKNTLQL